MLPVEDGEKLPRLDLADAQKMRCLRRGRIVVGPGEVVAADDEAGGCRRSAVESEPLIVERAPLRRLEEGELEAGFADARPVDRAFRSVNVDAFHPVN